MEIELYMPYECVWYTAIALYLLIGVITGRFVYRQFPHKVDRYGERSDLTIGGATIFFWPLVLVIFMIICFFDVVHWILSVGQKDK